MDVEGLMGVQKKECRELIGEINGIKVMISQLKKLIDNTDGMLNMKIEQLAQADKTGEWCIHYKNYADANGVCVKLSTTLKGLSPFYCNHHRDKDESNSTGICRFYHYE
jgi:hypothetical protein